MEYFLFNVKLTLRIKNLSGSIICRSLSITSKLLMLLPVTFDGSATDIVNFASGLRYNESGLYSCDKSETFCIFCMFMMLYFKYFIIALLF